MKKIIIIALAVFSLGILTANADNNRIITVSQLPKKAQQFISQHFDGAKTTYVKEEREFIENSFEVMFANGTKVEFTGKGEGKEVDCRNTAVPGNIIPAPILKYVNDNHPNTKVLKIERDRNEYEIRLSNSLELTFNKKFNIIDIDN